MIEELNALSAYFLGAILIAVASYVMLVVGRSFFWRAVDERINFRVRVLMADERKARAVRQLLTADVDVKRVRRGDEAGERNEPRDPGPVYRSASPPQVRDNEVAEPGKMWEQDPKTKIFEQVPLRNPVITKIRQPDEWADASSVAVLPAALPSLTEKAMEAYAVPAPVAAAPTGRKWVQPVGATVKPITAPKTPKSASRAGKKGKAKGKTQAKKKPTPRPSPLVLEAAKKSLKKINADFKAPEPASEPMRA